MLDLLEKVRDLYPPLPAGASAQELSEFEKELGSRLPRSLRRIYQDHNGEPRGPLDYRLFRLHESYCVSEGVWCFWECRYDPFRSGGDYHFADGSVHCDDRTFPSVESFLQAMVDAPIRVDEAGTPHLPEAFAQAEKLDGSQRRSALLGAIAQVPLELAPRLLHYLQDDDEAVVIFTCDWMARQGVAQAIDGLAGVSYSGGTEARLAARRALEVLGAQVLDYEVGFPVPSELAAVVTMGCGRSGASLTLLKRDQDSEWEMTCCRYPRTAGPQLPQAARERPGMYFGSPTSDGAHHLAVEVVANAVDQFLQGHATQVRIRHDEWTLEVQDDGHGYPLDSELGERYLTQYHDAPTVDEHAPHIHLVTQGVGLAPINAVCSEYQVESVRNGRGYRLCYSRGELVSKEQVDLDLAKGTRVRLTLDRDVWLSGFEAGPLRRRLFDFVHLIPGLTISLNQERFHAPRGLLDLAEFDAEGISERRLGYQGQSEFLILQVAVSGETHRKIHIESWVNGARTEEHGSHVAGALEALEEVGWRPARLLVHVILCEPRYAGPVRRRLEVPKALRQVRELMRRALTES